MRIALALASLTLVLAACGDNLKPGGNDPDAADVDAPLADARVDAMPDANCPARSLGMIGGPCTTDAQCDNGAVGEGFCLTPASGGLGWPAEGFCVSRIATCTNDADCGANNLCVSIDDSGGAYTICLPACGTNPCACSNGQACANRYLGAMMNKSACLPGNPAAIDGDPCTGFGDCDIDSICRNDGFEHPGGQCAQVGCTLGNDATCTSGGDGHCIDPMFVGMGTACVDTCVTDADCRVAEGYKCFDGGGSIGKYCRHPQTGDACATDADCGDPGVWDCKTGASFPGGYCTIQNPCNPNDGNSCSPGSSLCHDPAVGANYCVDRCTGAGQGTCRTGYTCTQIPVPGGFTAGGCI